MSTNTILISALVLSFLWTGASYAQEQSCQLVLTSEPAGAEVSIRDASGEGFIGKTPYRLPACQPGVYQLSIALEGYQIWSASLSVEPGSSYLLPKVVLEKKPAERPPLPEGGADFTEPYAALAPPLALDKSAATAPGRRSPVAALGLSVGLTAASFSLLGAGLALNGDSFGDSLLIAGLATAAVAPSAGHFYAGEWRHGLITSALRLSMPLVMIFLTDALDDRFTGYGVGVAGFLGLSLYDIIDSPFSALRHNKKLLLPEKKASFSLVPAPLVSPDGTTNLGLLAVGSF